MGLKEAVARNHDSLTEADRRILQVIFSNSAEAAFLPAAQLAQQAGVHTATVVRLAQKLGYQGYPELRADLQQNLVGHSEPAQRLQRRLQQAEDGDILGRLVQAEVGALDEMLRHVSQDQLDVAANTVIKARRIWVFAQGHATAVAELADRRLRRSGFDSTLLRYQGREMAERLMSLQPEDALLAFAFHNTPRGLPALMNLAAEINVPSILITDRLGPLVQPQPDLILSSPRGPRNEFQTLTVPMAITNALILTVARLDGGKSINALDRLSDLIDRFDAVSPD